MPMNRAVIIVIAVLFFFREGWNDNGISTAGNRGVESP